MSTTVENFVAERGIKHLLHFTRESNLPSILDRGLVRRSTLSREGLVSFNDGIRADGTDAICLSIGFPNYKMFYGIKQDNKDVEWVIVVIHPSALWELRCAFCSANAALGSISTIPIALRQNLSAFKSMYAETLGKERAILNIPDEYPTNPQAEVLMLDGVPRKYIGAVIVLNVEKQNQLQEKYPGLKVWVSAKHFRYRSDFAFWKAGV